MILQIVVPGPELLRLGSKELVSYAPIFGVGVHSTHLFLIEAFHLGNYPQLHALFTENMKGKIIHSSVNGVLQPMLYCEEAREVISWVHDEAVAAFTLAHPTRRLPYWHEALEKVLALLGRWPTAQTYLTN